MNNFDLHTPTRILFGKGAIANLRDQIPADARILVTYGGGSVKKPACSIRSSTPERLRRSGVWRD
jgi:NADP-dependent alcohol dehydrogenase